MPLLDARCTFEKALYYEDILTIKTKVSEINNKTIKLSHQIYRGETRAGNGYELRGWVKKDPTGKISAVPIPDDVKSILKEDVKTKQTISAIPRLNA